MNYRNLLIASLATGFIVSCSLNPKDDAPAVPDISDTSRVDLIEVNASLKPPAPSVGFKTTPAPEAKPVITRRRVEFLIGDEGQAKQSDNGYSAGSRAPETLAPSYPERPVPKAGMTRAMVVAAMGQPPLKMPGDAGAEMWDYGTYRVFFHNDEVAFTRVW